MSDDRFRTRVVKFRGCGLEFWSGVVGISERLVVFDGESPVCDASDLSKHSREVLANNMIRLWTCFRAGKVDPTLANHLAKEIPERTSR